MNELTGYILLGIISAIILSLVWLLFCFRCRLFGHRWVRARSYLLPARICERCDRREVKMPNIGAVNAGSWVEALEPRGYQPISNNLDDANPPEGQS